MLAYISEKRDLTPEDLNSIEADLNLDAMTVVNGAVQVAIDRPGFVNGALFGITGRRFSNGETELFGISEFRHPLSEDDWQTGVTTVNLDSYRDVVIKVQNAIPNRIPRQVRLPARAPNLMRPLSLAV